MKKKSLSITDDEKYGRSSPEVALAEKPAEQRKSSPTIELVGPQVDAFCACSLTPGETGTAKVHYKVKAVRLGEEYGSSNETTKNQKRVTLELTDVEADGDGEEEDGEEEETDEPASESADESDTESGEDDSEPEEKKPAAKKSVSPKDAKL